MDELEELKPIRYDDDTIMALIKQQYKEDGICVTVRVLVVYGRGRVRLTKYVQMTKGHTSLTNEMPLVPFGYNDTTKFLEHKFYEN